MKKHLPLLAYLLLTFIWSSTWLVIKLGLEVMPPFYSAGLRFTMAFFALSIYAVYLKLSFPKSLKEHIFLFFFGFNIFTLSYGLVYWAEQHISSGLTSVMYTVMPFYTLFLSYKMLPDEKITKRKILGLLFGLVGILIIFWDQLSVGTDAVFLALIAMLFSPFFSAYGTVLGKKSGKQYHPVTLNTLPLLYAGLSFFIVSFFSEDYSAVALNGMALFSVSYLAIFGTAIAFVVYFWLLQRATTLFISTLTFITPPIALLWGWAILDEPITLHLIAGMLIVFIGIWFVRDK